MEALATQLSEYDIIVVADASGSMTTKDMKGRSRWDHMQETLGQFAREAEEIDSDGIGLVVFSGIEVASHDGVTSTKMAEILAGRRVGGSTPLAEALTAALKLAGKSDKKDLIVSFLDGEPDDKGAVEKVIRDASNKLETDDALTFLFIQVGHDTAAGAWLKKLDDDLKGCKFDIVDAMTIAEAEKFNSAAELLIKAIND